MSTTTGSLLGDTKTVQNTCHNLGSPLLLYRVSLGGVLGRSNILCTTRIAHTNMSNSLNRITQQHVDFSVGSWCRCTLHNVYHVWHGAQYLLWLCSVVRFETISIYSWPNTLAAITLSLSLHLCVTLKSALATRPLLHAYIPLISRFILYFYLQLLPRTD